MNSNAATTWTCIDCGAQYPVRVGWCTSCGARGRVLMLGRRPRAELDAQPEVADASTIARLAGDPRPLPGLGQVFVGHGALAVLVGESGGGKSTLAARILDQTRGPALFVSVEEGLGPTLAQRLKRLSIDRRDFHLVGRASVDEVSSTITKTRAVAVAIDSVQASTWTPRDLRHLLALHPRVELLIAISQVNARGKPEGRHALIHEADLVIEVSALTASVTKSRYQEVKNELSALPVLPRPDAGNPLGQAPSALRHLRLVLGEDLRARVEGDRGPDPDQ
jgi:hypothetical protein